MENSGSHHPENQNLTSGNTAVEDAPYASNLGIDGIIDDNTIIQTSAPSLEPISATEPTEAFNSKSGSSERVREELISYGRIGIYALAKKATESRIDRKADKARRLTERVASRLRASELAQLPYTSTGEEGGGYNFTRKTGETYAQFSERTGLESPVWSQGEKAPRPDGKKIYNEEILPDEVLGTEYKRAGKRLRRQRRADLVLQKGQNLQKEAVTLKNKGKILRSSRSPIKNIKGVGTGIKGRYRSVQGKYHASKGRRFSKLFSAEHSRNKLIERQARSIDKLKTQAFRAKNLDEHISKNVRQQRYDSNEAGNQRGRRGSGGVTEFSGIRTTSSSSYPPRPSRQNTVPVDRARSRKARTERGKKWQDQQEINRKGVI